ncbi:hypothetical protein NDU88_007294 [Pleurodeles waltl]|uniref:Uncharacterized protein n=1 Tax=Pleurodeles waltl TaxID=8319 RepID=A0AAV7LRN9_PLEWA|nr:hypothetical protein NDU88_007294 [Pleurodeles waltl]
MHCPGSPGGYGALTAHLLHRERLHVILCQVTMVLPLWNAFPGASDRDAYDADELVLDYDESSDKWEEVDGRDDEGVGEPSQKKDDEGGMAMEDVVGVFQSQQVTREAA